MIEITYHPGRYALSVTGHAGYAEPGRDIVCAGVSALAYTAARVLSEMNEKGQLRVFLPDTAGRDFALSCVPKRGYEREAEALFEHVLTGFRMMEERYPGNVRIKLA